MTLKRHRQWQKALKTTLTSNGFNVASGVVDNGQRTVTIQSNTPKTTASVAKAVKNFKDGFTATEATPRGYSTKKTGRVFPLTKITPQL